MADDADRKEFDWDLPINVPTIGVHRTLRVTSNESIGAVMIKLASKLGKPNCVVFEALTYPSQWGYELCSAKYGEGVPELLGV